MGETKPFFLNPTNRPHMHHHNASQNSKAESSINQENESKLGSLLCLLHDICSFFLLALFLNFSLWIFLVFQLILLILILGYYFMLLLKYYYSATFFKPEQLTFL